MHRQAIYSNNPIYYIQYSAECVANKKKQHGYFLSLSKSKYGKPQRAHNCKGTILLCYVNTKTLLEKAAIIAFSALLPSNLLFVPLSKYSISRFLACCSYALHYCCDKKTLPAKRCQYYQEFSNTFFTTSGLHSLET